MTIGGRPPGAAAAWARSRWLGALCLPALAGCAVPLVDPACVPARDAASVAGATVVEDAAGLRAALAGAACGATILLAEGTYEGDFRLAASCPGGPGVVVGAARPGGAVVRGGFRLEGEGLTVAGLRVEGGGITLTGSGNRATRNVVRDSPGPAIRTFGDRHRVDRNEVDGSRGPGIEVRLDGGAERNFGNVVELNHVHDQAGSGNGNEAIRVLTDSYGCAGALVADNLLERIDVAGEGEAISIKARCVAVRGNTLAGSPRSAIVNRHGSDNSYEGNYVAGGRGLLILGDRHEVRRNRLVGAAIRLYAGNGTQDTRPCLDLERPRPTLPSCKGAFPAARDVVVADNEAEAVVVGYAHGGGRGARPGDIPAQRATVSRSGPVDLRHEVGTRVEPGAPRGVAARRLTAADVGPGAPLACGAGPSA